MNFATRRSNSQERAIVRAMVSLVGRHTVAVCELPVNLRMKVRKGLAHVSVELSNAGFIGRGSSLSGVIDEIVGEEFFEHIEVPFALDLFGISANNGFRRI